MQDVDTLVAEIRSTLRRGGSSAHARRIQRFFTEPVQAYGWRTPAVRRLAGDLRREMVARGEAELLLPLAEHLFRGSRVEEQTLAVILLERGVGKSEGREFRRLERWLRWVRDWSSCDALSVVLLGRLILTQPQRLPRVFVWARSRNRWRRRAALVSLVPAARKGLYIREILRLADGLLGDEDIMVQKGWGWLLKEATKYKKKEVVTYLFRVRGRAPRLPLRTACEKLPASVRRRILG